MYVCDLLFHGSMQGNQLGDDVHEILNDILFRATLPVFRHPTTFPK